MRLTPNRRSSRDRAASPSVPLRRSELALVASLLAGCATLAGDVEGAKRSWQGARYEEVVLRWGEPARHASLAYGRDAYTWVTEGRSGVFPGSVIVFGGSGGGGVGAVFGLPGMGGGELQRCERTLTFRDGRVVEQTWLGQPGLCSQLGKE